MSTQITYPTSYPDVNTVLDVFLSAVQSILNKQLVGVYLHGSLALGDFDPQQSDIDFVVVTAEALPPDTVSALKAMHGRLTADRSKWGRELEGSYISQQALRRYDPNNAAHPHIERGGTLRVEQHHSDWVVQRHILREYGVTLMGPPPQTLIDPIRPDELRQAVVGLLRGWWASQLEDTSRLEFSGYQVYAILTMCRVLYTLEHGTIVSKPVAARWAQDTLDRRWARLIERAFQRYMDLATLDETLDFIRHTLGAANEF